MKITQSKLKEIIREEIKALREKKTVNLDNIEYTISGKKITIEFDDYDYDHRDIQNWLKGNDDRVGGDVYDSLEDQGLQLDWNKKHKFIDDWTVQMFVKKL